MALSMRQLCSFAALAAVVAVADANRAKLHHHAKELGSLHAKGEYSTETCTDAQVEDIVNYSEELYADDCDVDPCSSECIDSITALYIALPDCADSDDINYTEITALWLEQCAYGSSSGGDGGYSAIDCTAEEESETDDVFLTYDTGACSEESACSDECLTDLDNFYVYLPNCKYSDGLNYLAEVDYWYNDCVAGSGVYASDDSSDSYDSYDSYDEDSDSYDDSEDKHKKSRHSPKWRK